MPPQLSGAREPDNLEELGQVIKKELNREQAMSESQIQMVIIIRTTFPQVIIKKWLV
jgi:hypothetical protein